MVVAEVVAVGVGVEEGETEVGAGAAAVEGELHGEVALAGHLALEGEGALLAEDALCPLTPVGVGGGHEAFAAGAPGGFHDVGLVGLLPGEYVFDLGDGVAGVGFEVVFLLYGDGGLAAGEGAKLAEGGVAGHVLAGDAGSLELVDDGFGPPPGAELDVGVVGDVVVAEGGAAVPYDVVGGCPLVGEAPVALDVCAYVGGWGVAGVVVGEGHVVFGVEDVYAHCLWVLGVWVQS